MINRSWFIIELLNNNIFVILFFVFAENRVGRARRPTN